MLGGRAAERRIFAGKRDGRRCHSQKGRTPFARRRSHGEGDATAMESFRSTQRRLPFGREEYASVWRSVPERDRKDLVALWARVIAAAARNRPQAKGAKR